MDRWGRLTPGPDVDDETFALLASAKQRFARLIGARPERVAFAPNTSYGLNAALWGLRLRKGERILLPEVEFPALVYVVKRIAQHLELDIEPLPCPNGYLEIETLQNALAQKAAVLALSWVQYFNGYRYDLEEISSLCHGRGCFVLVDAIQGVGAVPLDVERTKIDALACGAQKWLFGQTGSGFFYIADDTVREVEPLEAGWLSVDWGYRFNDLRDWNKPVFEDGRRWEVGTYPFFSIRFAESGLAMLEERGKSAVWDDIQRLLSRVAHGLEGSGYGPALAAGEQHQSGIMPLRGPRAPQLHQQLSARNIHIALREGTIRVSPHFYNTDDDMDSLIEAIREFETNR
jgi:selenocysteine lyase/cysteine desulfurase